MKGMTGRVRRVLAGLISAMMVLTSLPMTGAAVYAAEPVADATVDVADTAADVAEDTPLNEDTVATEDMVADDETDETVVVSAEDRVADEEASGTVEEDPEEIPVSGNVSVTFTASGNVTGITYGPTEGTENSVSMDDAKDGGATVSVNTAEHQKMIVTVSDDSLLLSDSVKVDGSAVLPTDGKYPISMNRASVTVDVTAYSKVTVSSNELKTSDGKKDLTKIEITDGVSGNGLTTGDAISFDYGYADGMSFYDVDLEAPEAWYMEGDTKKSITLTPPEDDSVEGIYSIEKEDVESAIRAGSPIHIDAKGEETEGNETVIVSVTVPKSVKWLEYTEYDPVKDIYVNEYKSVSEDAVWTENADTRTTEIEIHKGNLFFLYDYDYKNEYNWHHFFRVMRGNKELTYGAEGYYVGDIGNGAAIRIESAKLKLSDVKFAVEGNNETVSWNMSINPAYLYEEDGVTYVTGRYSPTISSCVVYDNDPIRNYRLTNMKYAVTGGSDGNLLTSDGKNKPLVPYQAMQDAAFAESSGAKLTVSAKLAATGTYKTQPLSFVLESFGCDTIKVVQGGADYPVGDLMEMKYADPVSITMAMAPGFSTSKVYLVKDADIKKAGLDPVSADYAKKLREAVTASKTAIPSQAFTPAKDGTVKVSIKKMDGAYTLVDVAKPKTEPVMLDDENNRIEPGKDGVYDLPWYMGNAVVAVYNGAEKLSISLDSVSANTGTEDVKDEFVRNIDPSFLRISGSDDAVAGKTVTLSFNLMGAGAASYSLKIRVSPKPSVKFADGLVSGDRIIEPQPMGTKMTYDFTVEGDATIKASSDVEGVEASVVPVKNKAGKITGYRLTVDSTPYSTSSWSSFPYSQAKIRIDAASGRTRLEIDSVYVYFSQDQVKKTDLSVIEAKGNTDSITLDFSKVKGIDRNTKGLYYSVSVSAIGADPVCLKKGLEHYVLIPATETKWTIDLLKDSAKASEDVEPSPVTYKVTAELIQICYITDLPSARSDRDKVFDENVQTVSDGVYATKIKLKKVKSAGTLYGGTQYGARYMGMDTTLIATVAYPNVGRKAVTEKRLKKLEILDASGKPVPNAQKFVFEENGNIYLRTLYAWDYLFAGKYTIVAYAVQPKGKDVKASMAINLGTPIFDIGLEPSTDTLYKKPGKAATLTVKAIYNCDDKNFSPKTKKAVWTLLDEGGNNSFTLPEGWSFKNGKLTIGKKATIPTYGVRFKIMVEPGDFARRNDNVYAVSNVITVLPVSEAPRPDALVVGYYGVTPGDVTTGDVIGGVKVLDVDGNVMKNVSIKTTGVLRQEVNYSHKPDDPDWLIRPVKLGKGSVKVTTTDGSGYSKTFKFNVKPGEGLRGAVYDDYVDPLMFFDSSRSTYSVENPDTTGRKYILVRFYDNNGDGIDHTLKLTGFKKVKTNVYGIIPQSFYVLQPTARNATIKVKEKKTGQTVTINVTNYGFPEGRKAAASITASNKIVTTFGKAAVDKKGTVYTGIDYGSRAAYDRVSSNYVTYTVKYGKTAAKAGDRVRLHVVNDDWDESIEKSIKASGGVDNGDDTYTMTLGEGGKFAINYIDAAGKYNLERGTYKIQVTPLDSDGNTAYNSGIITLKAVTAPMPSVKVGSKLSFTATVSGASVNLTPTKQANIAVFDNGATSSFAVGPIDGALAVRGANVGGKINGFAKMFKVEDGKLVYTGEKDPSYNSKKGISGAVAVNYTALDGSLRQIYVPVTVKGNF